MNASISSCTLCDDNTASFYVYVNACLDGSKLTISGVDCGQSPEQFWGDEDYEYWYYFDEQNTALLFNRIGAAESNPLIAMKERFSGTDGCKRLREFCDSVGIVYRFDSWV